MVQIDRPILTIGALEPLGSAGILIDWAVLQSLDIQPVAAVCGVILNDEDVEAIDATLLRRQLSAYVDSVKMEAVKTGLLVTRENIETVATFFEDNQHHVSHLVVDASLESPEEMVLLSSTAISLLKMRLLPMAEIVVAFLSEAERLSGQPVQTITEMKESAEAIKIYGSKFVLVRADRRVDDEWVDVFFDGREHQLLFNKDEPVIDIRRSRDVFSSALSAYLAGGNPMKEAILAAKQFESVYQIPGKRIKS